MAAVAKRVWRFIRGLFGVYRERRGLVQEALQQDEQDRREALRKARRAKRRALVLFLKLLNSEQRQEFRKYRHIYVTGARTGDRYRIRIDTVANIDVMHPDGTVKYRLCVRPVGNVPVFDVMAAQLLHLQDQDAEPRFLCQANILSTLREDRLYFRSIWLA